MSPAGLPAEVFGAPADRLAALGACHRNVIDATHHGTQATLQLLAGLAEEQGRIRHAWDVTARSDDTSSVNAQAVGLAETTFAACPEFDVVEVITVTPTGERLMQNGFEPGYKRLERARMHRSAQVRVNVGVSAALSRHTAANSWSTLARQRAATALEVADLLAAAPRRLAAHDNPNRRDAWVRRLKAVAEQCAALPSIPQVTAFDPSQNAVQADAAAHDEDSLSKLLGNFVAHLQLLVPEAGGRLVPLGAAEQLNKTSRKLREAMDDGNVLTVAGEAETYEEIDARSRRVAAVLACTDIEPSVARRIKGPPPAFDATVDALIDEVTQRQLEEQRAVLVSRFSQIPGVSIEWAPDEEAFSSALARQRWMVIVDVDDLDSGIAALEDWPDDIWPVAGPSVTLLAAHDGQLVPFAARLTRSLPAPWLPLGTDDVEELAASLSMSVITGSASEAVQAIVQQALETSWRLARAHLRFANWPVPRFNAASVVAELRTRVVAVVSDRPAEDLEQILTALIDDLDAETEGHNPGQLAASVLGPDFAGSPDAMTEPALAAFGIAVLLALDIDVQEAGRG